MKKTSSKLLWLFLFSAVVLSCQETVDKNEVKLEYGAVERSIRSTLEWAKAKDFSLLYSIILNDSTYLEVHPEANVVKGFDAFRQMEEFWASPDFKAIGYEISDLHINFSGEGNVAWFYCELDDMNEWKGEPANWMDTRWTGVLEKIDGQWRMMQMHFSNAVP